MPDQSSSLEPDNFWELLLSRNEKLVRSVFMELSKEEQIAVIHHLKRMSQEPGWHTEQRTSAEFALEVIQEN